MGGARDAADNLSNPASSHQQGRAGLKGATVQTLTTLFSETVSYVVYQDDHESV